MSNHNTNAPRRMTFAEFVTSGHDITGEWPYCDRHGIITRTRVSDPPSEAHTPTGSDIIAGYCAAVERRRQFDTVIEAMEQFITERCGLVTDTPDAVESDSTTTAGAYPEGQTDFLFNLVDHVADHAMEFGCFPTEHETAEGQVLKADQILDAVPETLVELCTNYFKTMED